MLTAFIPGEDAVTVKQILLWVSCLISISLPSDLAAAVWRQSETTHDQLSIGNANWKAEMINVGERQEPVGGWSFDAFVFDITDTKTKKTERFVLEEQIVSVKFAILFGDDLTFCATVVRPSWGFSQLYKLNLRTHVIKALFPSSGDDAFWDVFLAPKGDLIVGVAGSSSRNKWNDPDDIFAFVPESAGGDMTPLHVLSSVDGKRGCNEHFRPLRMNSELMWAYDSGRIYFVGREGRGFGQESPSWEYYLVSFGATGSKCSLQMKQIRFPGTKGVLVEGAWNDDISIDQLSTDGASALIKFHKGDNENKISIPLDSGFQ